MPGDETGLLGDVESAGREAVEAVLLAVLALRALGGRVVGEFSRRTETEVGR